MGRYNNQYSFLIPWFKKEGDRLFNSFTVIWNKDFFESAIIHNEEIRHKIETDNLYIYSDSDKNNKIAKIINIDYNGIVIRLLDNIEINNILVDLIDNGKLMGINDYRLEDDNTFSIKYNSTYLGYIENGKLILI